MSTLERSLHWQRHVLTHGRSPDQRARAQSAIARLEAQLQATASTDPADYPGQDVFGPVAFDGRARREE